MRDIDFEIAGEIVILLRDRKMSIVRSKKTLMHVIKYLEQLVAKEEGFSGGYRLEFLVPGTPADIKKEDLFLPLG